VSLISIVSASLAHHFLEIKTNREAAARYGINVGDVQDVIETAIGGRQRPLVRVRYSPDFRHEPDELRNNVLVTASNGAQIPLGQVTELGAVMGPSMISCENGLLRGGLMNVRGRDVGRFVEEAQRARPRSENAARQLHRVERTV